MPSKKKNLSSHNSETILSADKSRFSIVVSQWNSEITEALYTGAFETLLKYGAKTKNISRTNVPGSFELPFGAQLAQKKADVVICLGCVIQGETRHFEFISNAVANGIINVGLKCNKPIIFGVLTTDTYRQAVERAGGKYGNKGVEAAVTAIKMIALKKSIIK